MVDRGSFDMARAVLPSGPPASDAWDPLLATAASAMPRFEAAFAPALVDDQHWALLEIGDGKFHQRAILLTCGSNGKLGVTATVLGDEALGRWASER